MNTSDQSPNAKPAAANSVSEDIATEQGAPPKPLSPAAKRALAEAEARREAEARQASKSPAQKEVGGRHGPDPVRFGDWEKGGICSDF